jgi:hypothetical protein
VAARAFAHRRQPRAGAEQALADALGVATCKLLGERRFGAACERADVVGGGDGGVDESLR